MKVHYILGVLVFCIACVPKDTASIEEDKKLISELKTTIQELKAASIDETGFIHTVFFWCNEDITDAEKKEFENKGLAELMKISSIYKGYYGPPAMTPREVVDNSYDYALVCHFKNEEDQERYQVDPIHLKFIDDFKHVWKKVQVYDNLLMD